MSLITYQQGLRGASTKTSGSRCTRGPVVVPVAAVARGGPVVVPVAPVAAVARGGSSSGSSDSSGSSSGTGSSDDISAAAPFSSAKKSIILGCICWTSEIIVCLCTKCRHGDVAHHWYWQ